MWIKTLRRGYLNTAHVVCLRTMFWRASDYADIPPEPLCIVEAVTTNDSPYSLTQPVPADRAEELLRVIVAAIASDIPEPGTFQIPFEPPTE